MPCLETTVRATYDCRGIKGIPLSARLDLEALAVLLCTSGQEKVPRPPAVSKLRGESKLAQPG